MHTHAHTYKTHTHASMHKKPIWKVLTRLITQYLVNNKLSTLSTMHAYILICLKYIYVCMHISSYVNVWIFKFDLYKTDL